MDKTIAPAREPILQGMRKLLTSLPHDTVVVSGQLVEKINWQTDGLPAFYLGNNGNHAVDIDGNEIWKHPDFNEKQRLEVLGHIEELVAVLDHDLNHEWTPIEDRGSQITFSPIGNTAPSELKKKYDPDRKKREHLLQKVPFVSEDLIVKIGGSTSFDYIHKDRHKGTNVQKFIEHMNWRNDDCVYFGDGLYPGGNDELVIGVIDTIPVDDHLDTHRKIEDMFG